jgi:predicted ATP-grasp superfamily ATP-dependent carboligase
LNIDVRPLREKGENMRKKMEDLIKVMLAQEQQQQEQLQPGAQRMYT